MSTKTVVKVEGTPIITSTKRKPKDEDDTSLEDDGLEIVQVTPSPKKRLKNKNEVIIVNVKTPGRPVSVYREPYTILTMGRSDGANVLSVVPGGFTDLYTSCQYIRILHEHLSKELKAWIENVMNFVRDIHRDAPGLFDKKRSAYIKSYVMNKIAPLKRVLDNKDPDLVVHALNMTALKACFQCDDAQARFIYYLGAATEFQLKFKPDLEEDENTYEIYTLFSHGKHWNFGVE